MNEKATWSPLRDLSRHPMAGLIALGRGMGLSLSLGGGLTAASAQGYFPTVNPFVSSSDSNPQAGTYKPGTVILPQSSGVTGSGAPRDYNIKMGPVFANFTAGTIFTYQSNFNQVGSGGAAAQSLLTIGPSVGMTLEYQISDTALLQLGTGISYQTSIGGSQYDQLAISPNSSISYQFSIDAVRITVQNNISTANQATIDPTISGTGLSSLMEFNRLFNTSGLTIAWPGMKNTTVSAGYFYLLNTSIGKDNFQQFDSGMHQFTLSAIHQLGPALAIGVVGNGMILSYDSTSVVTQQGASLINSSAPIQNGSSGWSVGPSIEWSVTKSISASATISYNNQQFDRNGLVGDTSNFSGITPTLSISHRLNQSLTQAINGARQANGGNGSNFTETYTAGYSLSYNFRNAASIRLGIGFNRFAQSNAGFAYVPYDPASPPPNYLYINENGVAVVPLTSAQKGQQYTATLSTSYPITQTLIAGVSYAYIENHLNQDFSIQSGTGSLNFGGYQTHAVILSLAYKF